MLLFVMFRFAGLVCALGPIGTSSGPASFECHDGKNVQVDRLTLFSKAPLFLLRLFLGEKQTTVPYAVVFFTKMKISLNTLENPCKSHLTK